VSGLMVQIGGFNFHKRTKINFSRDISVCEDATGQLDTEFSDVF
jgi:hypothetical protein